MPLLARLGGHSVVMYFNDHPPPHFHVRGPDLDVSVRIDDLEPFAGTLPSKVRDRVQEWAVNHHDALGVAWEHCSTGKALPDYDFNGPGGDQCE